MFISEFAGVSSGRLSNSFRSYEEQIRRELGLLDGSRRSAYLLRFVPDDAGWPDAPGFRASDWDGEYLQSAGSAERMTIELRRREADGAFRQYAVGRADGRPAAGADEIVEYDTFAVTVRPSELFDAESATPVYWHYFQNHGIPDGYALREIDLS